MVDLGIGRSHPIVIAARVRGPMFRILFQGDLFADYFQIYLHDIAHPTLPDDYTDEAIADHLMVGPYGIIVHTARNMTVPVCVEWHHERPRLDLADFQHVVEGGFDCPTGHLLLAGLTDDVHAAPRLVVPAGPIGVSVCFAGLDTLDETGLDGDDRYLVRLWPCAAPESVRVAKRWPAS